MAYSGPKSGGRLCRELAMDLMTKPQPDLYHEMYTLPEAPINTYSAGGTDLQTTLHDANLPGASEADRLRERPRRRAPIPPTMFMAATGDTKLRRATPSVRSPYVPGTSARAIANEGTIGRDDGDVLPNQGFQQDTIEEHADFPESVPRSHGHEDASTSEVNIGHGTSGDVSDTIFNSSRSGNALEIPGESISTPPTVKEHINSGDCFADSRRTKANPARAPAGPSSSQMFQEVFRPLPAVHVRTEQQADGLPRARRKAVSFCLVLEVYLIPQAKEFTESEARSVWWSREQLAVMRQNHRARLAAARAKAPVARRARTQHRVGGRCLCQACRFGPVVVW